MKLQVDREKCVGHARCEAIAPGVFATDEIEGRVILITDSVPRELEQAALRGAKACPERAIRVFANEVAEQPVWPAERLRR